MNHLPPFLENLDKLKAKGVDVVAVVAANDAFVLSGWARFLGLKDKVRLRFLPVCTWSCMRVCGCLVWDGCGGELCVHRHS